MTDATTADAAAVSDVDAPNPMAGKRRKFLRLFAMAVLVIAALWGIWYLVTQAGRVHTDNAYVGADTAVVTPQVGGVVKEVRVGGTQFVNKGDVLVVLDDADAQIDLANAEAMLAQARARFRQARAQTGSAAAQVAARGASIAQARARVVSAEADYAKASDAFARRQKLAGTGAVSGEELDQARAAAAASRAALDLARSAIGEASAMQGAAQGDEQASAALTSGFTEDTAPDVVAAQAKVAAARLALDRTVIRAPIAGVVTNRTVQVGQRLQAGAPIMTLVPLDAVFVDANFKESQLKDVRPGQPVELTSDFYGSSVVYHGTVQGFAGGTGAAFALIPAQNATGNWVKVVQRLPVRVALRADELKAHPLRVGLTMDAVVDTRGQ